MLGQSVPQGYGIHQTLVIVEHPPPRAGAALPAAPDQVTAGFGTDTRAFPPHPLPAARPPAGPSWPAAPDQVTVGFGTDTRAFHRHLLLEARRTGAVIRSIPQGRGHGAPTWFRLPRPGVSIVNLLLANRSRPYLSAAV